MNIIPSPENRRKMCTTTHWGGKKGSGNAGPGTEIRTESETETDIETKTETKTEIGADREPAPPPTAMPGPLPATARQIRTGDLQRSASTAVTAP